MSKNRSPASPAILPLPRITGTELGGPSRSHRSIAFERQRRDQADLKIDSSGSISTSTPP